MLRFLLLGIIGLLIATASSFAFAQAEDDSDLDIIEAELKKSETKTAPKPAETANKEEVKVETFADLGRLAPFDDVSILQKRFMPKSNRFQFFGGLATMANDPWFYGLGFAGKLSYGFTEAWGIEGTFGINGSSAKDTIKDLKSENTVDTSQIVSTNGYYLVDVMWTPVYGKMTLMNQRIVPFDMYFNLGVGSSTLDNATAKSATTIHIGTGMIFALTRSVGFRWDLSINNYSAAPNVANSTAGSFNNVLLTLGASFYVPEVKYR